MKGENHQVLTEAADASSADPTKTRFRQVFVSLLADAKSFPGGISALARVEGRNPVVLADQINPDNHSKSPPTMAAFLELLENGQCRRTIAALNWMVGYGSFTLPPDSESPMDAMRHFLGLSARCSDAVGTAAKGLEDGRHLNAEERESLRVMLDSLISSAAAFRSTL